MSGFVARLGAWLRAWWAGQFMDEPPAFEIEPEEEPEETIYHILPYPLPHNEEYFTYELPDAGQDVAVSKGPEYRDGQRL